MKINVVTIEYSLMQPDPLLGDPMMSALFSRPVQLCPVLHIFGYTSAQQSAVVHVHGVFPYFFVPQYDPRVSCMQFAASLETVAVNTFQLQPGSRVVHHVSVVEGLPFYGFYTTSRLFFKVFIYNPALMSRIVNLLGSTSLGHVPFHFQFMIDYGVCGMASLSVNRSTIRRPLPLDMSHLWESRVISPIGAMPTVATAAVSPPFLITRGAPLPEGVRFVDGEDERDETPCLVIKNTSAAIELDCTAEGLQRASGELASEPGASISSAARQLAKYVRAHVGEIEHDLLARAIAEPSYRYGTVESVQSIDRMVGLMRRAATTYVAGRLEKPADASTEIKAECSVGGTKIEPPLDGTTPRRLPSDAVVAPTPRGDYPADILPSNAALHTLVDRASLMQKSCPSPAVGAVAARPDDNEDLALTHCPTFHVLDWMRDARPFTGTQLGWDAASGADDNETVASSDSSMEDASAAAAQPDEVGVECDPSARSCLNEAPDEPELLGYDDGDGAQAREIEVAQLLGIETTLTNGASVVCDDGRIGLVESFLRTNRHVDLQWYCSLGETHFSQSEAALLSAGRWHKRELFLVDRRDSVPLHRIASLAKVVNEYESEECDGEDGFPEGFFVCRYRYSFRESRITSLVTDADGELAVIPFPGFLRQLTLGDSAKKDHEKRREVRSVRRVTFDEPVAGAQAIRQVGHDVGPALLSFPDPPDSEVAHSLSLAATEEAMCLSSPSLLSADLVRVKRPRSEDQTPPLTNHHLYVGTAPTTDREPLSIFKISLHPASVGVAQVSAPRTGRAAEHYGSCQRSYLSESRNSPAAELEELRTIKLTQLYRMLDRPSLPLLTDVTPRITNARGDDRSRGMKRHHSTSQACLSFLKIACVEVIASAAPKKSSDASTSQILAVGIFVCTSSSEHTTPYYLCCDLSRFRRADGSAALSGGFHVTEVFPSESALLRRCIELLNVLDPDIILSWDAARCGLGFFVERVRLILREDALRALSRLDPLSFKGASAGMMHNNPDEDGSSESDSGGENDDGGKKGNFASRMSALNDKTPRRRAALRISGRMVLSLWKILRSELKQKSYTMQAVHFALFNRQLPLLPDSEVSDLYKSTRVSDVEAAFVVLRDKCVVPLRIAFHLDLFVRTSELAQIYGILFFEVLSRGSQFRVESILHRFAKPLKFVMVSPSREQVMMQNRQEGMALVMEPYSALYQDPVLVLDFRSLYPSIVIAYNLCFSTCVGKLAKGRSIKIGAMPSYKVPDEYLLDALERDLVTFAPNSCMFVKPQERLGVLPRMLKEILDVRFQAQAVMKEAGRLGDDVQRRVLDAQQLGLKMLANVTYGYAAATFTGRMPCSDIADAIVLLGRQTLERAIRLIESNTAWGAKVVYGDTDSLFVHLPGRSRREAFDIGEAIAKDVTASNPSPVTLKFEKVYHPCMLVVKKRYVGYSYEKRDQQQPKFDAKGIETVRRDQCEATSKICEHLLRQLFEGAKPQQLRHFFYEQINKLQRGDMLPSDVILRREVKLGTYAKESTLPPAARVALKLIQEDAAAAPAHGERVPYVVVNAGANAKLMDMVVHPHKLLQEGSALRVNADHYVTKHFVPSLDRLFHLVGISFEKWYREMPRMKRRDDFLEEALVTATTGNGGSATPIKRSRLDQFYQRTTCAVCFLSPTAVMPPCPPVCSLCLGHREASLMRLIMKIQLLESRLSLLTSACAGCLEARPVDIEDFPTASVQGISEPSDDSSAWAVPCNNTGAALLSRVTCVSLDCNIPFQRNRAAGLLRRFAIVRDFFLSVDFDGVVKTALDSSSAQPKMPVHVVE